MDATFLTYAPGAERPYTAWSDDLRVLAYLRPDEIVAALAALPRWEFVAEHSLVAARPLNRSGYPVVDDRFAPLWETCKIEVRFGPTCNAQTVTGRYLGTEEYAITRIRTDDPCSAYRNDPRCGPVRLPDTRDHTITASTFLRAGLLAGAIALTQEIGNHDRGFDRHYVRLADDPRSVCRPMKRTRKAKGAR